MQLVGPGVSMLDTMKNRTIGPNEVQERFGVTPDKVVDVQALAGDSTDNVPGVPGIGVKTAAQLINEFGDLDTLLANAASIKQNMRRERLLQYADQARLSRQLVRLKDDVPAITGLAEPCLGEIDPVPLIAFMQNMEFSTLTKRVAAAFSVDLPETPQLPVPIAEPVSVPHLPESVEAKIEPAQSMPAALAAKRLAEMRAIPID